MRWGEASALKWSDIDEDRMVIFVRRAHRRGEVGRPKNGRGRVVPLIEELRDVLRAQRRRLIEEQHPGLGEGWVFPTTKRRSGALALRLPSSSQKQFKRWSEEAELTTTVGPQMLRRTWVDLSRLSEMDATVRRAIVGHTGERVHDIYSTVRDDEAAACMGRVVALMQTKRGTP